MAFRLYSRYRNSAGERVRIVLALKELAYDYVPISSPKDPDYQRINPQALMPTLEIDGQILTQSLAMIEYLEEKHPTPSVFPADPILRAQCRAFATAIAAETHALTVGRMKLYLMKELNVSEADATQWQRHWVTTTFTALEKQIESHPADWTFCFGAEPTVADACLAPQMANARRFAVDFSAFPNLVRIDEACRAHPAFIKARPEAMPDYVAE